MIRTDTHGLPGAALFDQGKADILAGRDTPAANLIWMALPRLVRHRLAAGLGAPPPGDAEIRLYALLRQRGGNAYGNYNSLLREWISFQRALDATGGTLRGRAPMTSEL